MKLTNKDKFSFIPKRCSNCNMVFWLEFYNIYYRLVGIGYYSLQQNKCKRCIRSDEE